MKNEFSRLAHKLSFFENGLEQKHLSLLAAVSVFLTIVIGTGLSAVDGTACPDWPTCFGSMLPPGGSAGQLDYLHRIVTGITFLIIAAAAARVFRQSKSHPILKSSHGAALLVFVIEIALGAIPSLRQSEWIGALHLGLALLVQALILMGTTAAFLPPERLPRQLRWKTAFSRMSLAAMALVFGVLLSGAIVAASGATQACAGWPLCSNMLFPDSLPGWINMGHRLLVGLTGIIMISLLVMAYRRQRSQTAILVATTSAVVLFLAQGMMGAVNARAGYPAYLIGLHAATSAAIWASLVIVTTLTGITHRTDADEQLEIQAIAGRQFGKLLLDFLMLTKPIVVALLLVTTFAGMLIGAKSWPGTALVFWTMLGGFLAAGGSGAINQFIDREDDVRMQRTARRPIPAGRLTPAEGLAFGVGASLISFFVMVTFVNFTAALLSLAGILYYVVLYSLILKKTTVQNIVIGGGAGAIPPLVGWAAATGSLTFPSLLLFGVIFLWTPPHFWALAIVRRKDYARAGVPMLPVVRGEKETRWQVFLYTIELVALTLVLPVFGLGSSIYLIAASLLGIMLIYTAYQVWRREGNKIAWKMYRYSSMYLAFLFLALMIDRLLL